MKKLERILDEYKKLDIKKLSDTTIERKFREVLRFMSFFSNLYDYTEAAAMSKFEIEYKKYAGLIRKLGKIRFAMHEGSGLGWHICYGKLISEISRRWGLGFSDLFFYTNKEIKDLFREKKANPRVVNLRKKGFAFVFSPSKKTLLVGDNFKKLFEEVVSVKNTFREIKGLSVMKGIVKAKVEVIPHNKKSITKELQSFRKGNILVTDMTNPNDAVMISKKAAGIITDEGGITSHAAIISREFKIPCIVGTKIATQTLKTGNLVEVDANNGVVRILKR